MVSSAAEPRPRRPTTDNRPPLRGRVVWANQNDSPGICSTTTHSSFRTRTQDSKGNTVSLTIGTHVLKKYNVKTLIGKGSFSQVLHVENRSTKEQYAMKVIEKRFMEGNRYETELSILQRVRHPNILSLHEVYHSSSKIYMVLELAVGGDLFDKICMKGYFTEEQGKTVIRMVLGGIAYLHQIGICHRDLKLENLLYKYSGDDSRILISDFGLAHVKITEGDDNGMSTTCGTAEYLAPEMVEGDIYTEKIDLWALGVISYVVLCGSMPFANDSRAKLYQKIRSGECSFINQVCSHNYCS